MAETISVVGIKDVIVSATLLLVEVRVGGGGDVDKGDADADTAELVVATAVVATVVVATAVVATAVVATAVEATEVVAGVVGSGGRSMRRNVTLECSGSLADPK